MKTLKTKLTKHGSHLVVLVLILLINFFWLPTFSHWRHYPHGEALMRELPSLLSFDHPPSPQVKSTVKPQLVSQNFILIDVLTNKVLASSGPDQKIYPASVTKLATALTALNIYPLDEVITVKEEYKQGKVMELKVGEKISIKNLINALIVYSANDAAFNLASYHTQGIPGFIKEMNLVATKYGLVNTHFTNFDGIHDPNHYSTAYDLAQLARLAYKNNTVKEVARQKYLTVTDVSGSVAHPLLSTNELLEVVPEIEGLKTGWTPEASGTFVGIININGHYLVSVVAQTEDRFGDTTKLIDWAKLNVTY